MIHILHIEDDKDDRDTVESFLWAKIPEIKLTNVSTGKQALSWLAAGIKNSALPGIIILDLKLKDLNGKDIFTFVRNVDELAKIRIAVLTASDSVADKMFFAGKTNVSYYQKPSDYWDYDGLLTDMLFNYP